MQWNKGEKYEKGLTIGEYKYGHPTAILKSGMRLALQRFDYTGNCNFEYTGQKTDEQGYPVIDPETGKPELTYHSDNRCGQIIVDVNGSAGANQQGADTFTFCIYPISIGFYDKKDTFMTDGKLNYEEYNIDEAYEE